MLTNPSPPNAPNNQVSTTETKFHYHDHDRDLQITRRSKPESKHVC
jgi:hypothetical protein